MKRLKRESSAYLSREVEELKQALALSRIEATNEYERFFAAYRKLLKDNPNMVREFNELYPLSNYHNSTSASDQSLNGHRQPNHLVLPTSFEIEN
ncbi:MAG: hypothetical protein WCO45_14680 [Pseudanabaena sp. ELA607]